MFLIVVKKNSDYNGIICGLDQRNNLKKKCSFSSDIIIYNNFGLVHYCVNF